MNPTRTLFRPVGLKEAELILGADARRFPPRLPEQPIFYPVLNLDYASQIAREWNAPREPHFAGFVTRFAVESEYVSRFDEHVVGRSIHRELWVPAEDSEEFNRHIVGRIEFVEAHYGAGYQGPAPVGKRLRERPPSGQLRVLADLNEAELADAVSADILLVRLNLACWRSSSAEAQDLDEGRKAEALDRVEAAASRHAR